MPGESGNKSLLWIESSVAATFNAIKGQVGHSIKRSHKTIDTTTKDDFPYETSLNGFRGLTISLKLIPKLPDVNGYQRLETLWAAGQTVKVQSRKNGATGVAPADVEFEAEMNIQIDSTDWEKDSARAVSVTLTLAAPPTIDSLK